MSRKDDDSADAMPATSWRGTLRRYREWVPAFAGTTIEEAGSVSPEIGGLIGARFRLDR